MTWQHETPREQLGHSAEFGASAPRYRVPGSETPAQANFTALGGTPTLGIAAAPRRGRTVMQRNFSQWLNSAQAALGWAVILVILATASGVYLQQVSRTALIGRNAQLLGFELTDIRQQNNVLRQEITYAQSLDQMRIRSQALGIEFVEPNISAEDYIQIVVPADVPPQVTEIVETPPLPPERFGDALRIFVVNYVNTLGRGVANGE